MLKADLLVSRRIPCRELHLPPKDTEAGYIDRGTGSRDQPVGRHLEDGVGDEEHQETNRKLIGCQHEFLLHAGCLGIPDVGPVKVIHGEQCPDHWL